MKLRIWSHFLKKILDGALHFLCSVKVMYISGYLIRSIMLNNMTFDIYLSYVWQLSVHQEFLILCRRYHLNKFISFTKLQHCSKMQFSKEWLFLRFTIFQLTRGLFRAKTIKRLSPRSKCYCFSHSKASTIQKLFLSVNHGCWATVTFWPWWDQPWLPKILSSVSWPPTLKSISPELHFNDLKISLLGITLTLTMSLSITRKAWKKGRSSRPEVFCKKNVLRNLAKFTGKHLWQSLFLTKLLAWGLYQTFMMELFAEIVYKQKPSNIF